MALDQEKAEVTATGNNVELFPGRPLTKVNAVESIWNVFLCTQFFELFYYPPDPYFSSYFTWIHILI